MARGRKLAVFALVLAILAAIISIATYGITLPAPFAKVDLRNPRVVDSDGSVTAIADSESRRLIILDAHNEVTGMVAYNSLSTPIEAVTDISVSDGTVYVAGAKYEKDGNHIVKERVLAYDVTGGYLGTLSETVDSVSAIPTIISIKATPEAMYMASTQGTSQEQDGLLHFFRQGEEGVSELVDPINLGGSSLYMANYSPVQDKYVITDMGGVLEGFFDSLAAQEDVNEKHLFSSADIGDDGNAYAFDELSDAILRISPNGDVETVSSGGGFSAISCNGDMLSCCSLMLDSVGSFNITSGDVMLYSDVNVTRTLSLKALFVFACRAYAVLYLVACLAIWGIRRLRAGQTEHLGAMFASVSVVMAVSIAIGYTSYVSYMQSLETRLQTIDAIADYFGWLQNEIAEDVAPSLDRSHYHEHETAGSTQHFESYGRLYNHVGILPAMTTMNGIGIYTRIYAQDSIGVFCLYDSLNEYVIGASLIPNAAPEVTKLFESGGTSDSSQRFVGSMSRDVSRFRLVPIADGDGRLLAVIELGTRMKSFEASVLSDLTERICSLLVMMAVVHLAYAEIRACGRNLIRFYNYEGGGNRDALALLTRPFTLCVTALSSIDGVMTVLIAKELVGSNATGTSALLVAIPSVMLGLGLALGHVLYGFIGSRVSPRRLALTGTAAVTLFSGLAISAIVLRSLPLYCAAKLLLATPLGTLYSFGYSLPRNADTSEVRGSAQDDVSRTDTSAAALGTVLGGYAAQMLGSLWVYVLIAVMSVLVAVFVGAIFPRGMEPLERPHVRSLPQTVRFLTSQSVGSLILFIMLPAVFAGGYDSFLFPLFSAEMGMSTSAIHNISAFGKLIVYVSIGLIGRVNERFGKWVVSPASVALIGVTFVLFSFNETIAWAVVVIALLAVFSKSADGWKTLWLNAAGAQSFPHARTTGMMFATRSILLTLQPLVLTSLLTWGEKTAIICLGLACLAGAGLFVAATRKSDIAPA